MSGRAQRRGRNASGPLPYSIYRRTACAAGAAVVLLCQGPSPDAQVRARDPVHRVRHPLEGQYVVRLQDHVDADAVAVEAARVSRGRLRHIYRHALRGFAIQMSDTDARTLARDSRVAAVEEDGIVTPAAVQLDPPSWGLDRIDQRRLPLDGRYTYATPPTAVNVYVLDSGLRITHAEFEGRALIAADFVDDDGDGDPADVGNDDLDPGMPDGADCLGHGTHTAGTVGGRTAGVARTAVLWGVRVFGCDGIGTWSGIIAAVEFVTAEGRRPAVVNMSLAGAPSVIADEAVQRSIAAGFTYVAAAGNAGDDAAGYSPARVGAVLVTGSTGPDDRRSIFSNWGTTVDMFAPGEGILSAAIENDADLAVASGTSAASAHVAGVAALYLGANPGALPAEVHAAIAAAASRGVVSDAGSGPNRLVYSLLDFPTSLTVTYPNGPVNWGRGSTQPIVWSHDLAPGSLVRVLVSRDGGASYEGIAAQVRNTSSRTGHLLWTVTGPNTTAALVRVESLDGFGADTSDSPFVIADPYVRLTAPNGHETWHVDRREQIRWEDNLGAADQVAILLSKNGGTSYRWVLLARTPADGVQALVVPRGYTTHRARLKIAWVADPAVADVSDAAFIVRPH